MKEKILEEPLEKNWEHFLQIWKNTQKQYEVIFNEEIPYVVVSKDKLPQKYSNIKEFLGVTLKKYPDNKFKRDLMIFVEDIVPKKFQRYVVFHELREGRRNGNSLEDHQHSISDQIWLSKRELTNKEFGQFIQWLKNHRIIPKEWSEF